MRKAIKYLAMAGIALSGILPMARGQASATNKINLINQETTPNGNYKITQTLRNTTPGSLLELEKAYPEITFGDNLSKIGCTNIQKDLSP